jgi:hypothetical protein
MRQISGKRLHMIGMPGSSEVLDVSDTTALGGGSIVIHK